MQITIVSRIEKRYDKERGEERSCLCSFSPPSGHYKSERQSDCSSVPGGFSTRTIVPGPVGASVVVSVGDV